MNVTERVLAEVKKRETVLLAAEMAKLATAVNGQRCDLHARVALQSANGAPSSARRAGHNPYDPRGTA